MLKNGMIVSVEQYIKDSGFKKPKKTNQTVTVKLDENKINKVLRAV